LDNTKLLLFPPDDCRTPMTLNVALAAVVALGLIAGALAVMVW
jgi:hypothetical protein